MNLSIQNASKQYQRDFWGLRDFSLELGVGMLGLLGQNGAGKSTLLRIFVMSTDRVEGVITLIGGDIAKHPDDLMQVVDYLPQYFE